MSIFLIGPMGAGKTTIGKLLSKELNYDFVDSDHVIESRTGASISWIFDIEGEDGFRKREESVIAELTQLKDIVLATGGGVILSPENRTVLVERGTVVYLKTSIEQQYQRTYNDKKRPLLQTDNLMDRLQYLAHEREPLYEEIAHFIAETSGQSVRNVIKEIVNYLRKG